LERLAAPQPAAAPAVSDRQDTARGILRCQAPHRHVGKGLAAADPRDLTGDRQDRIASHLAPVQETGPKDGPGQPGRPDELFRPRLLAEERGEADQPEKPLHGKGDPLPAFSHAECRHQDKAPSPGSLGRTRQVDHAVAVNTGSLASGLAPTRGADHSITAVKGSPAILLDQGIAFNDIDPAEGHSAATFSREDAGENPQQAKAADDQPAGAPGATCNQDVLWGSGCHGTRNRA
jgi:hypothetical protein